MESLLGMLTLCFLRNPVANESKGNGTLLSPAHLDTLFIQIVSTSARISDHKNKPIVYSEDSVAHPEVTLGKVGGVAVHV